MYSNLKEMMVIFQINETLVKGILMSRIQFWSFIFCQTLENLYNPKKAFFHDCLGFPVSAKNIRFQIWNLSIYT